MPRPNAGRSGSVPEFLVLAYHLIPSAIICPAYERVMELLLGDAKHAAEWMPMLEEISWLAFERNPRQPKLETFALGLAHWGAPRILIQLKSEYSGKIRKISAYAWDQSQNSRNPSGWNVVSGKRLNGSLRTVTGVFQKRREAA